MDSVLNSAASMFNAFATYVKYAVSFVVSNPLILGLSVLAIIGLNKSVKFGRLVAYKG